MDSQVNEPIPTSLESLHPILLGLSDLVRLRLITEMCLHLEPLTPSFLASALDLRPATVSHHLLILEQYSLAVRIKSGRNSLYTPNRDLIQYLALNLLKIGEIK